MENVIALGLLRGVTKLLDPANLQCEMCTWLEAGFQTAEGDTAVEAYVTEILLHRRLMHVTTECLN